MWLRDMQIKSFISTSTENFVNLEKTSEMAPIKDEFLASYSKQNFW